jgi:thiol-disulfide isomerase/thioredoxin
LEALCGKVAVIDFCATWCGPCRTSIPLWNELVDAFKGKAAHFLAITGKTEQVVAAFLKRTPIHSWVRLDGTHSARSSGTTIR